MLRIKSKYLGTYLQRGSIRILLHKDLTQKELQYVMTLNKIVVEVIKEKKKDDSNK